MLQSHSADFELSPAKESNSLIQKIHRGCYGNTEIITDIENLVNLSHHKGTVAEMVFLANPTYLYKCIRRISAFGEGHKLVPSRRIFEQNGNGFRSLLCILLRAKQAQKPSHTTVPLSSMIVTYLILAKVKNI